MIEDSKGWMFRQVGRVVLFATSSDFWVPSLRQLARVFSRLAFCHSFAVNALECPLNSCTHTKALPRAKAPETTLVLGKSFLILKGGKRALQLEQ